MVVKMGEAGWGGPIFGNHYVGSTGFSGWMLLFRRPGDLWEAGFFSLKSMVDTGADIHAPEPGLGGVGGDLRSLCRIHSPFVTTDEWVVAEADQEAEDSCSEHLWNLTIQ